VQGAATAAAQRISRLGAWEGYEVEADEEVRRAGTVWCVIRLKPMIQVLRCCSGCGEWVAAVHDLQTRRVRDLPIFETSVELVVPRVRLLCPRCGTKLEHLSWLEPFTLDGSAREERGQAVQSDVGSPCRIFLRAGLDDGQTYRQALPST
jgi:transposase